MRYLQTVTQNHLLVVRCLGKGVFVIAPDEASVPGRAQIAYWCSLQSADSPEQSNNVFAKLKNKYKSKTPPDSYHHAVRTAVPITEM